MINHQRQSQLQVLNILLLLLLLLLLLIIGASLSEPHVDNNVYMSVRWTVVTLIIHNRFNTVEI